MDPRVWRSPAGTPAGVPIKNTSRVLRREARGGSIKNPLDMFSTSVLLCIYMHRLKWNLNAKQSVCLVDPISMLLSQLRSQIRSQFPSSSCMFEAIGMRIMSSSRVGSYRNGPPWAVRVVRAAIVFVSGRCSRRPKGFLQSWS